MRIDTIALPSAPVASTSAPSAPKVSSQVASKLEPFLLIGKSARGAGARKLVEEVTSAPGVYYFGEILDLVGISELAANPESLAHYQLLQVFAYGTWNDYKSRQAFFPSLNAAQTLKLKQLTLVSLGMRQRRIPYPDLLHELDLPNPLALEDLVTQSIYAEVLQARLDQRGSFVEVDWTVGRDVRPVATKSAAEGSDPPATVVSVDQLRSALSNWSERIRETLTFVDGEISRLREDEKRERQQSSAQHETIANVLSDLNKNQKGEGRGSAAASGFNGSMLGGGLGGDDDEADTQAAIQASLADQRTRQEAPSSPTKSGGRVRKRGRP